VAMVAMMPLLSIQMIGFIFEHKKKAEAVPEIDSDDLSIVDFWEEETK
jgi:hypothetical protein